MHLAEYKVIKNDKSPQSLFGSLKNRHLPFLLESSLDMMGMGRYSLMGCDPYLVLRFSGGRCFIEALPGAERPQHQPPLSVLREELSKYALTLSGCKNLPPFLCGAVGFLGYEFGFSLEEVKRQVRPVPLVPDLMFGFYDCGICVDHLKGEVTVFSSGFPAQGHHRGRRARRRLREVLAQLDGRGDGDEACRDEVPVRKNVGRRAPRPQRSLVSNLSRDGYIKAVVRAKEYIAAGDIYQVNLAQMFKAHSRRDAWTLYRRLTRSFPVAFAGFFKTPDWSIVSASPERFLRFDGRTVCTRPMKGTRRRTASAAVNAKLRRALGRSRKEKAELLMILDLERNDLGRVCDYGSIRLRQSRVIEAYANIFQATAEVEGCLHKSKDRLDLLHACFPGGSITGCPKIRAMEVIEELEPDARGVYTGCLGYLSFHNTLEFSVLIRSFLRTRDQTSFHVGAGIVSDSRPQKEYEETLVKARALVDALGGGW